MDTDSNLSTDRKKAPLDINTETKLNKVMNEGLFWSTIQRRAVGTSFLVDTSILSSFRGKIKFLIEEINRKIFFTVVSTLHRTTS